MKVFLMHVGHPGNVDIAYTVTRRRGTSELLSTLPAGARERDYFQSHQLAVAFPNGHFNCWGVPTGAAPAFRRTQIGDLVLIAPTIGVHGGGIDQVGIVKALCPFEAHEASRILWPDTPHERLFPWLFFFDTEVGHYPWFQFLEDLGLNGFPHGWYGSIRQSRFDRWGGPQGFHQFLHDRWGFQPLAG